MTWPRFNWKWWFFMLALLLVAGTLLYARYLAQKIEQEERQRVAEWVQANKALQTATDSESIGLAQMIQFHNEDMPLIAVDQDGRIIDHHNLDSAAIGADSLYLGRMLSKLRGQNPPIDWEVSTEPPVVYKVYYGNTRLLSEVQYYPLVQLLLVGLFIVLLIALLTTQNRSAQNQVWAGMAKETAHQMGTPLTSLQGWIEVLREQNHDGDTIAELEKDVARLKLVSDRFGKIGSTPQLEPANIVAHAREVVDYMRRRAPGKVHFSLQYASPDIQAEVSPTLLDWVLENLLKNALDAMEGEGNITVEISDTGREVIIDVTDTGKGIPASLHDKVFAPGFSTKKRGWGLGLSLSKRIVEQYHGGQLSVKWSEPGKGTTFRILLPRR